MIGLIYLMSTNLKPPSLDKWKIIQFGALDAFDDSDEQLKKIGMTSLDIRLFRDWQKGPPTLKQTEIGGNPKGKDL